MALRPLAFANIRRCAATCRSSVATVSLPPPLWYEADKTPWSCVRDPKPRILTSTERCAHCAGWQPRDTAPDGR
jgi:hypothetical protein